MNAQAEGLVLTAFLAFCRVGACFLLMPGLSSVRVPVQVRLFVAVAATAALLIPTWDQIAPYAVRDPALLGPRIASELTIGGLIGLLTRLYVLALSFIASAIGMMIGFNGIGGMAIEEAEVQGPLASLITFTALMLLFVFNFHHEVVKALVESYRVAPVAVMFDVRVALVNVTDTLGEAFMVMVRLGSPFIAYGLLVNLTIGFVNKLTPQIPVYFISLPFVVAGGLILLYFALPMFLSLVIDGFLPVTLDRPQ